jgi:DNA-binding transcriptional MerR regulator
MEVSSRIPEKLFFRIGEVCELIRVQPHVLRYWETEFPMLAPQKNRAGQRVYRRKDVEMVMRIRDLLYEEKFTIAGAKKKLMDEMRGGASRARVVKQDYPVVEEPVVEEPKIEPALETAPAPQQQQQLPESPPVSPDAQSISPQVRRVLRVLKHDLEDLLTRLNQDASIKN